MYQVSPRTPVKVTEELIAHLALPDYGEALIRTWKVMYIDRINDTFDMVGLVQNADGTGNSVFPVPLSILHGVGPLPIVR